MITGNLLNIKDAYSHPMFYRGIDDSTGFRTRYVYSTTTSVNEFLSFSYKITQYFPVLNFSLCRNILCFPIKNEKGKC